MTRRLELTPGGPSGRRTLAEEAAAELHELILSGELPSGTALRLEELAKRLDMSQMPIREGLRRMAALGLVEIVAAPLVEDALDLLASGPADRRVLLDLGRF